MKVWTFLVVFLVILYVSDPCSKTRTRACNTNITFILNINVCCRNQSDRAIALCSRLKV